MNKISKVFLSLIVLGLFLTNICKAEEPKDSASVSTPQASDVQKEALIKNLAVRFMLRSQFASETTGNETTTNFQAKPSMIALSFDMGDKFSFYSRYRFDFPATIQSDGTPVSLIAFNLQYKPTEKFKIIAGKQMMLQGSWEFEYCPIDVFYYSLMGNYIQGFVTGVSGYYTHNDQILALQVSKVVESDYEWNNSKNGWNSTLYYAGNIGNGFYKPIWSATYTYAGAGKSLFNVMLGNQFNIGRVRLELDAMAQNSFRYYPGSELESPQMQQRTNEYSLVGDAMYLFPGDRFMLGGKYAYDKRNLTSSGTTVTEQQTISMQLRYNLSKKYGITVHTTGAYRLNNTPVQYGSLFTDQNQTMFSAGFIWDFTLRR